MKSFNFRIYPNDLQVAHSGRQIIIALDMTQAQFEDYQWLKKSVHAAAKEAGYPDIYNWHDEPAYTPELLAQLRQAIGCDADAELILYHAHSYQHQHYKKVMLDGVKYRYMAFSDGRFIKIAQELTAMETA